MRRRVLKKHPLIPPQRWWHDRPAERYWLEATDRPDIGRDLRAPMADAPGDDNWRYTLFREARPGDVVYHYDASVQAITSWSVIAGRPRSRPITWAARGSYARERHARPVRVPGYVVPLRRHSRLARPLTLATLRSRQAGIARLIGALGRDTAQTLYFPFELRDRPLRPLQGYAFKLPAIFVKTKGPLPSEGGMVSRIWKCITYGSWRMADPIRSTTQQRFVPSAPGGCTTARIARLTGSDSSSAFPVCATIRAKPSRSRR